MKLTAAIMTLFPLAPVIGVFIAMGLTSLVTSCSKNKINIDKGDVEITEIGAGGRAQAEETLRSVRHHLKDLQALTKKKIRKGVEIKIIKGEGASIDGGGWHWHSGVRTGGLTFGHMDPILVHLFAHPETGKVDDWIIRHEVLHCILTSHGKFGHPKEYKDFARNWHGGCTQCDPAPSQ